MKQRIFALVFGLLSASVAVAAPTLAPCYNDDSLDEINDNRGMVGSPFYDWDQIRPTDCYGGATVGVDPEGRVTVNGKTIYDRYRSVRVSQSALTPDGVVAFLTSDGKIHRYDASTERLTEWYSGRGGEAAAFKLSRTGELLAVSRYDRLITSNGVETRSPQITALFASRSGRIVALAQNGEVVDASGAVVLASRLSTHREVKIAANGVVVAKDDNGALVHETFGELHDGRFSKTRSFKINSTGGTAFDTEEGSLYRALKFGPATRLHRAWIRDEITDYRISDDGAVIAVDVEGKTQVFNP